MRAHPVPAWERVMERTLALPISPRSKLKGVLAESKAQVYRKLGWKDGQAYWKRRGPDLRLSELGVIARSLGVPVGKFCSEVWLEMESEKDQEP